MTKKMGVLHQPRDAQTAQRQLAELERKVRRDNAPARARLIAGLATDVYAAFKKMQ